MSKRKNLKEQTRLSFQLGGTTPMPGTGVITTPNPAPTTGFKPYVPPVIPGFTGPQLQGTQFTTATQSTNLPTFGQVVGTNPGQYDELRRYVNDAGIVRQIPFKNGQPIYPIPEGFRFEPEGTTQVTTPTTTPTTTTTIGQQDGGGGDDGFDGGTGVAGSVQGPASKSTGLSGIKDAISNVAGRFTGQPAQAQPYGGTTLSGLTNMGTITDFSNNITGVQDALGVFGHEPINMGIVASMLMGNPLGAMASASGIGPSSVGMFGQSAPTGHGAFPTDVLQDYARGRLSKTMQNEYGISMSPQQAQARAQVQAAIGTEITGLMGYSPGSISPITGTPVNSKGRVVNFNGSSRGVDAGFQTMGGWIDAMKASVASGYYGGPLSRAEVAELSEKGRKGYAAKARALGYNEEGEGPPGSGGAAAEAALGTGPERGIGPTGRRSSTGRQDYSGGQVQDQDMGAPPGATPSSPADYGAMSPEDVAGMFGDTSEGQGDNQGGGGPEGGEGQPGGMGVICLTEDMKVRRNGVIDFVTNVRVGDIVDYTKVTEVLHKHMREGYYVVNGELKITNDHPVLANGSWKRTEDLVLGDYINNVEVTSLEYVEQVTPTVYIGTADDRYNVYTEGEVYTVHGQYKNALKKAA